MTKPIRMRQSDKVSLSDTVPIYLREAREPRPTGASGSNTPPVGEHYLVHTKKKLSGHVDRTKPVLTLSDISLATVARKL